ncbi:MAG: hypothetical protein ACLR6J_05525 [Parabacteroides merdae]
MKGNGMDVRPEDQEKMVNGKFKFTREADRTTKMYISPQQHRLHRMGEARSEHQNHRRSPLMCRTGWRKATFQSPNKSN